MTLERPLPPAGDHAWIADLRTPCYVYEPEVAIARYRSLKARLGTRLIVSLKANPNRTCSRAALRTRTASNSRAAANSTR